METVFIFFAKQGWEIPSQVLSVGGGGWGGVRIPHLLLNANGVSGIAWSRVADMTARGTTLEGPVWCLLAGISHSAQWFSLWIVYQYRPISHSVYKNNCNLLQLCDMWLDCVIKYKHCSFFVRSHSLYKKNCNLLQLFDMWLDRVRKYKRSPFFVR